MRRCPNKPGYDKHEQVGRNWGNFTKGKRSKTLLTLGAHTPRASPPTGMSCWFLMVPSLRFRVGVQLGWSKIVWGFQWAKSSMNVNICRSETRTSVRKGT